MLRALSHPNIISILDVRLTSTTECGMTLAIYMPRIKTTLKEQLRKVSSLHVMLRHAHQLLDAIHYLHEDRKMMHRDVKPDNILFEPGPIQWGEGRVLLADFGTATWIHPNRTYTAPVSIYPYSAPETILPRYRIASSTAKYDGRIDMFAFGCIFWEMLTRGRRGRLFGDITSEELAVTRHEMCMNKKQNLEHNLRTFAVNDAVGAVLLGTLQLEPEHRMTAKTALVHIQNAEDRCTRESERASELRNLERMFRHAHTGGTKKRPIEACTPVRAPHSG
jgi:serine/threonine protein kinase